jgi:methionyl-tRNA synthetase
LNKVFITCALPYANGPLHLGHLRSTYIPADIYARYNRMKGREVLFVCATDEHGTPIAVRAEQEGKSPVEVAGRYFKMIKSDLEASHVSFDNFSRTSDDIHYQIAQHFFLTLYNKGYIYEKTIKQLYCTECDRFLPDRYVEGVCPQCKGEGARGDHCETCGRHLDPVELLEPSCLLCQSVPEVRESEQFFFQLSHFQEQIKKWIETNKELPPNVRNYAMQWIKEGLKDWILTRDMDWGVPVPLEGSEGKIIYVWGEAFLGYISSAAQWAQRENKTWEPYWDDGAVHFIGKDIIYHHSIFWPALLLGYGCKLPKAIVAGEYLSLEGLKMSTSKNWVIWASDFLEKFDYNLLRYYLVANAPLTRDTDFSWEDFQRRVNEELADVLGNFLHRTFSFTNRFFAGQVPEPGEWGEEDEVLRELLKEMPHKVGGHLEKYQFRDGLREIIKLAKHGNKYFNDHEPWKTVKCQPEKAATFLYLSNQIAKTISMLLVPYLPGKAFEILEIMNIDDDELKWDSSAEFLSVGHTISSPQPLFPKIDDVVIQEEKEILYKNLEEKIEMKDLISIENFAKIDLRVGMVIGAEKVKGSDNLLKLMVDIKDKKIQVVAGLAKNYEPEDLLKKKVIVLANLQPAKLFGIKSEGMILATSLSLNILDPGDADLGEKIK